MCIAQMKINQNIVSSDKVFHICCVSMNEFMADLCTCTLVLTNIQELAVDACPHIKLRYVHAV